MPAHAPPCRGRSEAAFSLLEVMIATTLLTTGLLSLAQLFGLATTSNRVARDMTLATVLAMQKLEELRSLSSPGRSPRSALEENTPGYVDFVDALGAPLGGGRDAPPGAVYVRRWSVEPLPRDAEHTVVIQVIAARIRPVGVAEERRDVPNAVGTVRLVTVKTRKAP